ncbi:phage tail protein I [Methylorubrum zatmanii]
MTDLPKRDALLPDRAGPLERAIAKTEGRLDDLSMDQVRRVRSVDDALSDELDHLAAERSVDVYDPRWPLEIRRDVVRGWPQVQAKLGTPFAIELALSAMRVRAELTEWWETAPKGKPYTFTVLALVGARLYEDGTILDARTIKAIYASVLRTKAHARAFDLRIGVRFTTRLGLAPVAVAVARVSSVAEASLPVPPIRSDLGAALVATVVARVSSAAMASVPVPPARSGLGLAPVAAAIVRLSFSAVAA